MAADKREGLGLEAQHRLAGDLRHLGVLADGAQRAAVGRAVDAAHHEEHDREARDHDQEIDGVEVMAERGLPRAGDARDAVGAAGQPDLVGGDEAHRLRRSPG